MKLCVPIFAWLRGRSAPNVFLGGIMKNSQLLIILLLVFSFHTSKANNTSSISNECKKFLPLIKKYNIENEINGFKCGEDVKNKKLFQIPGFNLVAAIKYDQYSSSAYYSGDKILDGVISYQDGPNESLEFKTKSISFSIIDTIKEENIRKIKYPQSLKCKSGQPKADAKIKIIFFNEIESDSCQAGSWVIDYEVISVGPYSCRK